MKIVDLRKNIGPLLYNAAAWHLRRYASGKPFPLAATFQLTNRCNLRCIMCNIPNNPAQGVLPLWLFTNIVKELSEMGCCYASLSGGEVLTISNFFDYLHAAKKHIPSVNTVSNGLLLDSAAAREFQKTGVDSVSISLDGMERTHELMRGQRGAFLKAVEAIENIKVYAPGIKIVVNTVIAPWNIDELIPLAAFVRNLGVLHKFQPLNEHPSFEGQARKYSVEKKIDMNKVRELVRTLLRQKNVANSGYFLRSIPDYFSRENKRGLFADRCALPSFFCEFREDGLMYPCLGGMGWKGGYPAKDGVRKIFESPEYRLEVKKLEECRFCQKSYSVCYIEPRVTFPFPSFFKYRMLPGISNSIIPF